MAKLTEPDHLPSEAWRYKDRIENDSARLPGKQCGKCDGRHFYRHQKRPRWFLVVVCTMVCPILCVLYRWRCVNCGATFTQIPSLCVRFKRYLRSEIEKRASAYVETEAMSYRKVVKTGGAEVVYDDPVADAQATEAEKEAEAVRALAASTPHRWISSIAAGRERLQPIVKQAQHSGFAGRLSTIRIASGKYRFEARKRVLEACSMLLRALLIVAAKDSTELATSGSSP